MPLSTDLSGRTPIHTRSIECRSFSRPDGLWDIEGHLKDTKTYNFKTDYRGDMSAGMAVHDMSIRLTLDDIDSVRQSINRYYVMESRLAIPEAGAADRAWMYGDSKRGSLEDTTARLFFQFRSHQVKLIRAMIPRVRKMGVSSLMHVMPALTFGYVAISLKKMAAGKAPPAFDDPNTLTDALVHSGVAGFLGDFVAGQYGRYQHELDEVIAGSAYSTIKNWADLAIGLQTGDKNASDVWKNLRYNIPFGNLFYTEAAINYGLHYGIMETFSPGYLQRMEAREDGLNTGFIVNPSTIWSFGGLR